MKCLNCLFIIFSTFRLMIARCQQTTFQASSLTSLMWMNFNVLNCTPTSCLRLSDKFFQIKSHNCLKNFISAAYSFGVSSVFILCCIIGKILLHHRANTEVRITCCKCFLRNVPLSHVIVVDLLVAVSKFKTESNTDEMASVVRKLLLAGVAKFDT